MKTIETYLPNFNGFYHSAIDSEIDFTIDLELEHFRDELNTNITYDDLQIEYGNIHTHISEDFTLFMETYYNTLPLDISIEFDGLHSPKYYNYSTDSINIKMSYDEDKMADYIRDIKLNTELYKHLKGIVKDNHSSRSGFWSFHSNNIDEWIDDILNKYDDKVIFKISTLLGYILDYDRSLDYDDSFEYLFLAESEIYGIVSENIIRPNTCLFCGESCEETFCSKACKKADYQENCVRG